LDRQKRSTLALAESVIYLIVTQGEIMRQLTHARHVLNCIALSLLLLPTSVRRAEIKVLSDGPLRPILPALAVNFERNTGHHVDLAFAPAPVLADRVSGGEVADVLIVRPDEIDGLVKAGKVIGQGLIVSRIGTGLMVREDRPVPDISSPDAFKRALLPPIR
jgi:molybdate transport system substrate-binding protein